MRAGPHRRRPKQLDRDNRNQEEEEDDDLITVASR
jgi:hypothetical protein